MVESKTSNTKDSKPEENRPGGATEAQAKQAKEQGTATGVEGVRGEEGGQQTSVPGAELPAKDMNEADRTDADRMVNPSPNVGAVLNPPINPTKEGDEGKPVYIPPPGSQNRELRKNLEKHAGALRSVFEDQDADKK